MIVIRRCSDDPGFMQIDLTGNAEVIAQEYVALTLKLLDEYPIILDRANWYLKDIGKLRMIKKEVDNEEHS